MHFPSIKKTFIRGIALALPLLVTVYMLKKVIEIFEKLIRPIALKFGVEKIFGEITITLLAVLVLIILLFVLGLLMYLPWVARYKNDLEDWILKLFPSLNHLKLMAEEKLHVESASTTWKPVLVSKGDEFWPAYLIEEDEDWVTLALMKVPSTEPMGMMIIRKQLIKYSLIPMDKMHHYNKAFGKGYLSMISSISKN